MITVQGPPESILKWVELYTPIVAGMAFFVGLFVRGKINDKAIADLTIATTENTESIIEFREAIALLKKSDEDMYDDIKDMDLQQRQNTATIHSTCERVARLEGLDEGRQRK